MPEMTRPLKSTTGNYSKLCEDINKYLDVLKRNVANIDSVLETLDPQMHALGVLAVLNAKYSAPASAGIDFETLFSQTQLFFTTCNGEQVRFATDNYAYLAHFFTQALVQKKQPIRGISTLLAALAKIQLHPGQLTSIHADICQLCLLSKNMKPALPLLDTDITDISQESGHFDATSFLCYYYYGGMIYAAQKNWNRSAYFFEVAITTPSMAVSHIVLEAYKKYILVSLILHGKVPNLPKYTSPVVSRFIKPLSQSYHELSNACASNSPAEVRVILDKHTEQFTNDKNMGLAKQVLASLYRKNIQRLTKTFLTLSLADIARRVHLNSPEEAEQYVQNMIEDGEIYASISKKDGMVSFHDNPEKYDNPEILRKIDDQLRECMALDEKLRSMEQEISVNTQFVQKSTGGRGEEEDVAFGSK
ncbi:COP9 signalosome complex subunit 3 [Holothuria leucospilota]|uniref:COP9 signalosome complex subunit 3 n=1 Tax=Holothuria leucospilota TaxID=206669 RepID=A0A9Q1C3C9_HOLLE|nr:COP9 signalosome complex subunit 3 [Holothuria leucospilota]